MKLVFTPNTYCFCALTAVDDDEELRINRSRSMLRTAQYFRRSTAICMGAVVATCVPKKSI
jgi:hypothetical protein